MAFGRNMSTVFDDPDDVRTIILPKMVRTVRQGSFCKVQQLRVAVLNEGLEILRTDEYQPDGKWYSGAFQERGLRRVRLPSTLKRIEYITFRDCKRLGSIDLPEKLEYIGIGCFQKSALASIRLPGTLKTIRDNAFSKCADLKSV